MSEQETGAAAIQRDIYKNIAHIPQELIKLLSRPVEKIREENPDRYLCLLRTQVVSPDGEWFEKAILLGADTDKKALEEKARRMWEIWQLPHIPRVRWQGPSVEPGAYLGPVLLAPDLARLSEQVRSQTS